MCRFDPGATVSEVWSKRVESYSPSQTSIKSNDRVPGKYRWWRRQWEGLFGPWLQSLPPAKRLRRVTIIREYGGGKRAFDRINFAGGAKPLLDTIVNFGALYDDSEIWCQDHYVQKKSQDGIDYVTVLIEELSV